MVPPRLTTTAIEQNVGKEKAMAEEEEEAECGLLEGSKKARTDSRSASSTSNDSNTKLQFHFANSTRYLVLFLTTMCLSLSMSNSVALNFTVICMNNEEEDDDEAAKWNLSMGHDNNITSVSPYLTGSHHQHQLMFDNAERALLFSAVPVGTLLGTLPITPLASRFGIRKTIVMYGFISAIATLLTPPSASIHLGLLLLMRFLQGVAVAICFPASGAIIAEWCPLRSSGTVVALLSCHIQFGPILTMPLAGELCESSWGWQTLYYLQAALTFMAYGAFFAFFRDTPHQHRNVSSRELCKIQRGKPPPESNPTRDEVPYRAMFRDPAVWGIFLCSMGSTFGFYVFMQYGPIYLHKTLKFDVERTGFAVALPCLLSLLAKFIVGPASDYATCVSDRVRILMFATLSQVLMALCFCALALLPSDSPRWLLQSCFTAVTVVCGVNCAGVGKSAQLISRQYAHMVSAFSVFACACTIIVIPILVGALAPDNEPSQWSRIFLIVAAVVIICVLVFDCTAEATPRPWTFSKRSLAGQFGEVPKVDIVVVEKNGKNKEPNEQEQGRERAEEKELLTTTKIATDQRQGS